MYKKISDYGIVGNLYSAGLIAGDGSVDWLCWPTIGSPSIFGSLLDAEKGGSFSIAPSGEWDSVLSYLEDSNVLACRFRTRTGTCTLTDFMPVSSGGRSRASHQEHLLIRLIHVQSGRVQLRVRFEPRFRYGQVQPDLKPFPGKGVVATGAGEVVALSTSGELAVAGGAAEGYWELKEGDRVAVHLRYGADRPEEISEPESERILVETLEYWRTWLYESGPGFFNDLGRHRDQVVRSLLVLKLLFYEPNGTMAAAATTSLPEVVGGVRNWDYRFSWVRDTCMALSALFQVGHIRETEGYLRWLEEIVLRSKRNKLQVLYGLSGTVHLREETLGRLAGYKGSRPVRVGNGAVGQKQFSIYGNVLVAAHLVVARNRTVDPEMWHGLRLMCDYVADHWQEPDSGIWEMRTQERHFVHSKVMCWATLDRGIRIADLTGAECNRELWEEARRRIRQEVSLRGWNEVRQAFVLHYDTDALDGSLLLMSIVGFLPYDHPRMLATVEAIRRDLSDEGFVYRYRADDGLPGREGTFLPCTLWLTANLAKQGERKEAELLLARVDELAGHRGLLAEEYDPAWREQLGNFPQAFTHEAYILAAMALAGPEARRRRLQEERILPPPGNGSGKPPEAGDLAEFLEEVVAGFPAGAPREGKELTRLAARLAALLADLAGFDLDLLETDGERLAFWANLCNLLLLNGVVMLDVKVSVKEVPWFYRRVGCIIGGEFYSAEIVLHGILRGNRPAPGRFHPPLPPADRRLVRSFRPSDPRILLSICTGTVSSPPITVLRPETLEDDLRGATTRFLRERATIDLERKRLVLPTLFKWYDDFGKTDHDVAVFVAGFAGEDVGRLIRQHPEAFELEYAGYDWRINRGG
jgi:GH15 family glucan-1,4-alpha-glucosidase